MGALMDHFRALGVGFAALPGGNLRATGPLTDAIRVTIREHKAAILGELAANDAGLAHFRWSVTRPGAWAMEVRFAPEATREEVEALYPGAICAPLPDADDEPTVRAEPDPADRRTCRQCANLSPGGRCLAAWRGESLGDGIAVGRTYEPDRIRPQRCAAYLPGPDDADRRTGAERWPTLVAEKAEKQCTPRKANADTASQPI